MLPLSQSFQSSPSFIRLARLLLPYSLPLPLRPLPFVRASARTFIRGLPRYARPPLLKAVSFSRRRLPSLLRSGPLRSTSQAIKRAGQIQRGMGDKATHHAQLSRGLTDGFDVAPHAQPEPSLKEHLKRSGGHTHKPISAVSNFTRHLWGARATPLITVPGVRGAAKCAAPDRASPRRQPRWHIRPTGCAPKDTGGSL